MTDTVDTKKQEAAPAEEKKAESTEVKTTEVKDKKGDDTKAKAGDAEDIDTKQQEPTAENEIRVAAKGQIKNYLGYAFRILNKTSHTSLKIRATGNAIVKANILIELVKRRVGDLHQLNSIYSMVIQSQDDKNPLAEKVQTQRRVTAMDTLLSKDPLDVNDPGYQEPVPKDEPFATQTKMQPGAATGGNKTRDNQKKDGDEKREGGKGRGRRQKLYNQFDKNGQKVEESKDEAKDGAKDGEKKGKDKGKGKQDQDDKKKDKKGASEKTDAKDGKMDKDKGGRNRRTRKEKLNAPAVKDDEVQPGKKAKQDRRQEGDRRPRRGGMMQPDMYGGHRGMGMGMMQGNRDGRNPQFNMPPMDNGYGGPRQRDPRNMPPYMGYPPRSYDDFNVRPRGNRGNQRGHYKDNYRNGPNDRPMYMYAPYDMYYPMEHYGAPDRRNYGQGPDDSYRYNQEPTGGFRGRGRGDRMPMRDSQDPDQDRRGGRGRGRPEGMPPGREMRGEDRDQPHKPRMDQRDGRQDREPREPREQREFRGPPRDARDEEGRGQRMNNDHQMRSGPDGPSNRMRHERQEGGYNREDRPTRQRDDDRGFRGNSSFEPMRGGRGMRGSRGGMRGMRGGGDRGEPSDHFGDNDDDAVIRRNPDHRGGRGGGRGFDRGYDRGGRGNRGYDRGGHHEDRGDGHQKRGRGGEDQGKSHQIVTRTRGGRGGSEATEAPTTYN